VWYFTPFYSMLRATTDQFTWAMVAGVLIGFVIWFLRVRPRLVFSVPVFVVACVVAILLRTWDAKFWGVVVMGGSVMILFGMPWLDRSPARSIRYRPEWHKLLYLVFVVVFVILGYIGTQPPSPFLNIVSQIGTVFYFSFFLGMPIWSQLGHFKPVPDRIVFHGH
jgi:ubiquinol-cytochrome c reductase cytochrome b subunit